MPNKRKYLQQLHNIPTLCEREMRGRKEKKWNVIWPNQSLPSIKQVTTLEKKIICEIPQKQTRLQ